MAEVSDIAVSLRIYGVDLDPTEISALLECEPSRSHRRGDPTEYRSGPQKWDQGAWFLESPAEPAVPFEVRVRKMLDATTPDLKRWIKIGERFQIDLFCGLFLEAEMNQGVGISKGLSRLLADRGIHVEFDIYSSTHDDPID